MIITIIYIINPMIHDIYEEIDDFEHQYEYEECENNKYYIGTYSYIKEDNILLLISRLNKNTFFKYKYDDLSSYLYEYSYINFEEKPPIEIIQMVATDDMVYTAILKTFWIKIIQRKWKKIMKQRKQYEYDMKKNILSIIIRFECTNQIRKYPTLRGML